MGHAPTKCPMCGEDTNWKIIDTQNKGFSVGKAALGGFLLGPVGLVGGALGKKKSTYYCGSCKFSHEYDGGDAIVNSRIVAPEIAKTSKLSEVARGHQKQEDMWNCSCGSRNKANSIQCRDCGKYR